MREVYVMAVSCTAFGKRPNDSFKDLTREAYLDVLDDAGWENGDAIEQAWFGNCGMGTFGQRNIRGQVCFTPLVREGLFPERIPIINVEGGCATASMAFHGAWKDVASGDMNVSFAIGVENGISFIKANLMRAVSTGDMLLAKTLSIGKICHMLSTLNRKKTAIPAPVLLKKIA